MSKVPFFVLAVATLGCSKAHSTAASDQVTQQGTQDVAPPAIDLTTPDRALRSLWALEDSSTKYSRAAYATVSASRSEMRLIAAARSVRAGDALRDFDQMNPLAAAERFSREIVQVTNESESRAVVLARIKNVTVPSPDAVASTFAAKDRESGEEYRYIFERDSAGWKLSQIYSKSYDGADWRPRFTPDVHDVPWMVQP